MICAAHAFSVAVIPVESLLQLVNRLVSKLNDDKDTWSIRLLLFCDLFQKRTIYVKYKDISTDVEMPLLD